MGELLEIAGIDVENLVRTIILRASKEKRAQSEILKEELKKIVLHRKDKIA